jgi:Periplasmic protease
LERLHQNGAVNLVLDLRNNPGGYLSQAVKMVNQLIDEKEKLLVYTQGDQNKRNNYYSTGRVFFPLKNICILVNENTASAAEVVAGAFQDHDRGFLIGQPTYGKGLVQNQFRMNDGAGLKLTVAKYYTPSGRCIQRSFDTENDPVDTSFYFTSGGREVNGSGGITPDFIIKEPMREQLGDRFQVIKNEAQYFVVLRYFNKIDDTNIFNYLKKSVS